MMNDQAIFKPRKLRKAGLVRRAAILDAATRLFLEKGFEAASLADILQIAGGSRRTIYDQFRDKEGLFQEMMAIRCAAMLAPMDDPLLLTGEPEVILRKIADRFMTVMTSDIVGGLRRIGIAEGAKFPAIAKIFFEFGVDPAIESVSQVFESLNNRDELCFQNPQMTSITFLSIIQGDVVDRLTAKVSSAPDEQLVEQRISYAINLILTLARQQALAK
jgi:TetR/AcrR family transcriptional regulator, mexJK operon transcriptional repressor